MRFAWFVPVAALALLPGCPSGPYFDAGADRPPIPARTFDVDNSGMATCPGELFGVASEGRASCSRAPQRCISQPSMQMRQIVCTCDGSDGGLGEWACRELNP